MQKSKLFKFIIAGDSQSEDCHCQSICEQKNLIVLYKASMEPIFVVRKLLLMTSPSISSFWDMAGQERFQSLGSAFYRGADGLVLVCNLGNEESFQT